MSKAGAVRLFLGLMALASAEEVPAAVASSSHYSLDYVSVAASGAIVEVGNYRLVTQTSTQGVAVKRSASGHYSITPLVGVDDSVKSSVADWSIY